MGCSTSTDHAPLAPAILAFTDHEHQPLALAIFTQPTNRFVPPVYHAQTLMRFNPKTCCKPPIRLPDPHIQLPPEFAVLVSGLLPTPNPQLVDVPNLPYNGICAFRSRKLVGQVRVHAWNSGFGRPVLQIERAGNANWTWVDPVDVVPFTASSVLVSSDEPNPSRDAALELLLLVRNYAPKRDFCPAD
jgi:hypothetical protein